MVSCNYLLSRALFFGHDRGMDIPQTLNDLYTFPGYRPQPTVAWDEVDEGVVVTLVRHRIPQKECAEHAGASRDNFTIPVGVAFAICRAGIGRSGCRFPSRGWSVCGAE